MISGLLFLWFLGVFLPGPFWRLSGELFWNALGLMAVRDPHAFDVAVNIFSGNK